MLVPGSDVTRSISQPPPQPETEKQNRRIQRISLPLPARVEVMVDAKVSWNQITRLNDVSAFGAGFTMEKPVKRGRLVLMTIPMPRQLRSFDYSEPQYKVWALVRRCLPTERRSGGSEYSIGVAFIGRTPPSGHIDHPWMLYDISHREGEDTGFFHLAPADVTAPEIDTPKDARRQTRLHIPEPLLLEKVDEAGNVHACEMTVTENISLGGAAVFTTMDLQAGSFLRVTSERFNITILAVVRGARVGQDGIKRAHLEFIDRFFPLEGIE